MLPKRLVDIDARLLVELCENGWPESQILEFKLALPAKDEDAKVGFAKDVCAFANADGGDIVFGIAENKGKAARPNPIDAEPVDGAQRRLLQTIETLVEPRIVGLQFQPVQFQSGGYALVLRVPASFDGPHRFTSNGASSRFVIRVGTMTLDLTYAQLRGAFDRSATLGERAREFRSRRIAAIKANQTWRPLTPGVKVVIHLMPIAAMGGRTLVDVVALNEGLFVQFTQAGWAGASRTLNLEGMVIHPPIVGRPIVSYVQVFRSGALEAYRFMGRLVDNEKVIPGTGLASHVRDVTRQFVAATKSFGIAGPAIFGVAILDATGYRLGVWDARSGISRATELADRADFVIPGNWIERIEAVSDVDEVVRPALDILYQSFDVERCYEYDEQGRWIRG